MTRGGSYMATAPREFQVLRCCSCRTFCVQIKKKKPKFTCPLCYTKQSVRKVYASAHKAAQLRPIVQQLNLARRHQLEQEPAEEAYHQYQQHRQPQQGEEEEEEKWNQRDRHTTFSHRGDDHDLSFDRILGTSQHLQQHTRRPALFHDPDVHQHENRNKQRFATAAAVNDAASGEDISQKRDVALSSCTVSKWTAFLTEQERAPPRVPEEENQEDDGPRFVTVLPDRTPRQRQLHSGGAGSRKKRGKRAAGAEAGNAPGKYGDGDDDDAAGAAGAQAIVGRRRKRKDGAFAMKHPSKRRQPNTIDASVANARTRVADCAAAAGFTTTATTSAGGCTSWSTLRIGTDKSLSSVRGQGVQDTATYVTSVDDEEDYSALETGSRQSPRGATAVTAGKWAKYM